MFAAFEFVFVVTTKEIGLGPSNTAKGKYNKSHLPSGKCALEIQRYILLFSPLFTPPLVAEPLLVEAPGIIGDSIEIMAQFLA